MKLREGAVARKQGDRRLMSSDFVSSFTEASHKQVSAKVQSIESGSFEC
jgi:hypothetical protein